MPFGVIIPSTSNCTGTTDQILLPVNAPGRLSMPCPVDRVNGIDHLIYGWNGSCSETPERLQNVDVEVQGSSLSWTTPQKFKRYFGLIYLNYKVANGKILTLLKSGADFHGKRIAVLRVDFPQGGCDFVPMLIGDDIPVYDSHAEAGCCPCAP